jgi:hypothetical protein
VNPADPSSPQNLHVDAGELKRRIAVCFSATDLRIFAEEIGLGHIASWERGVQEGARELVRHFEREHALPDLLEKLREARPLVEWPEPVALSAPGLAFVPGPAPALASPQGVDSRGTLGPSSPAGNAPGYLTYGPAQPTSSPGHLGSGPPMSSPGHLGSAPPQPMSSPGYLGSAPPQPMSSPGYLGSAPAYSESAELPPPSGLGPASRSDLKWVPPGHEPAPAEPARTGIDPRILIAVSALMVLGAGIAYLAGRASSSGPAPVAGASAAPAGRSPSYRTDGPAGRAAQVFERSLTNVARACEVPMSGSPDTDILASAFEQCGPLPPDSPRRLRLPPSDLDPPAPTAEPARPRGPARPGADRRETNPPPSGGEGDCISGCDGQHKICRSSCGPEPKQSSEYAGYQACQGRCLTRASLCRRACN